ncbi:hypothetical protein ABZ614_30975, partial [Streptomyces sp. NPDC013178]
PSYWMYLGFRPVRREGVPGVATGRTLPVAALGADFHIGLPDSEFGRVADVVPPPFRPSVLAGADPNGVAARTFTGPLGCAEESWRLRMGRVGGRDRHRTPGFDLVPV